MHVVEWVATAGQLERLGSEWDTLLARSSSRSVFLSWPWVWHWWRVFGRTKQLAVLAVRDGARLVAIAPWYRHQAVNGRLLPVRRLETLGHGEGVASEHLDIIVEPSAVSVVVWKLAEWLVDHASVWDDAMFRSVPTEGVIAHHLLPALAERGLVVDVRPEYEPALYIPLPQTWDTFLGTLSGNMRHGIRRQRRAMERDFTVEVRDCCHPERLPSFFAALRRLHASSLQRQGLSGKFEDPRYRTFHEMVAASLLERRQLVAKLILLNGQPVSARYGFSYGGVFSDYQSGFDTAYQKYGVSKLLCSVLVEEAIQQAAVEFDFLRGSETYKFDWTQHQRWNRICVATSRSWRGRVCAALVHLRKWRRLAQRMGEDQLPPRGGGTLDTGDHVLPRSGVRRTVEITGGHKMQDTRLKGERV